MLPELFFVQVENTGFVEVVVTHLHYARQRHIIRSLPPPGSFNDTVVDYEPSDRADEW